MSKIIPPPANYREGRRLRAWQLYEAGWKQKDIAEALGISEGAVSQWISKARAKGAQALRMVPHPGPHPKLSQQQRIQLPRLLDQGAEAFGFHGNVWTTERVVWLIKRHFGISYHPAHCSRLLRQMRYSQQQPITRATQRDEAAITIWREQTFPALKKNCRRATHSSLCRRASLFSACARCANLLTSWENTSLASSAHS